MSKIPQQFIDDLINRIDIAEIIEARVALKKAGKEYKACCPFHNEKTPSFTVSSIKQFYHCFGCGANGNAISFLMEYDHLSFPEAIESLAKVAGVEVPSEATTSKTPNQQPLYDILATANDYFQQQLREHENAISYLKKRGVSGAIAKQFSIGFAPKGWDNLSKTLKAYSKQQLVAAGLYIEKSSNEGYDRFRNRIMFPIRDRRGRIIAFGGRVLSKDDEPKYLNSPETEIFHKRRELYGLYETLQANRNLQRILVVEGYMDVVALAQYGINYAVATLGTATTEEHLQQLFRHCNEVTFCFDGDRAGYDAAWKALNITLPVLEDGWQINFMFLAQGEDPDSTVRAQGREAFENSMKQAIPLAKFIFKHLTKDIEMERLDGQAKLVTIAMPLIEQVPGKILQHKLLDELATHAQVPISQLESMMVNESPEQKVVKRPTVQQQPSLMQHAISILLQHPMLADNVKDAAYWRIVDIPGAKLFSELVDLIQAKPKLSTGAIIEHWRDNIEHTYLTALAIRETLIPEEGLAAEFQDTLSSLRKKLVEQQLNSLQRKAKQGELNSTDRRQYLTLLAQRG